MAFNVLIVDDSPAMRTFVRRVLELSGIEVNTTFNAADGAQALELIRANRIDVILTDINMPRMDGEELLRTLKADDVLQSIPVVVISTDSTQHRVQKMLTLGANGYVTKPFQPETLREEIEKVLGVVDANF